MAPHSKRLIAFVVVIATIVPASTFAENRSHRRTTAAQLEADMARVFGRHDSGGVARPSSATSILAAMNRERAAYGLGPLRLNETLSLAATDRIDDMFAKRYFAHVSPDGIQPFTWARKRGYRYSLIGENLAVGYSGTSVVDGWMRSPGHRENILQRSFDEVGLAIADGAPQRGYRGPTVVALYGAR